MPCPCEHQVKAHLYLLPRKVQPHLDPSYNGRAKVPGLFRVSFQLAKCGAGSAVSHMEAKRAGCQAPTWPKLLRLFSLRPATHGHTTTIVY